MSVEVSIEPVTGWRLWGLSTNPPGIPVLNSAVAGRVEWPAPRRYEARCAAGRFGRRPLADVRHVSPSLGCTCGIYASASLRDLMSSTPALPALSVVGTVSMWGRTIEHERGWRSEYAYPARLTLVCAECLRSGSGEGKPGVVALGVYGRSAGELVAVCSDHGGIVAEGKSFPLFDPQEVQGLLLDRYAVDPLPFHTVRALFERARVAAPVARRPPPVAPPPAPVAAPPTPVAIPAPTPVAIPAPTPVASPVSAAPAAPASTNDPLWLRFTKAASAAVSFCLGLGFVVFMVIASLQSCIVSVDATEGAPVTPALPTVPVTDASSPTSKSVRWVRPDPLPEFAFVCGRPHGGWIELVDCSRAAPLTGSAMSPPDDSCFGEPEAITLRPRYSICWMSFGEPVAVDPRAAAANPFDEETA